MTYWWETSSDEKYWTEITDRRDIGADLKCPQTKKGGKPYWSYDLVRSVWPGDIVFHYSTRIKSFVGASVAGGPLESRSIVWRSHSTRTRQSDGSPLERPGWWLPLYGFSQITNPLTLKEIQDPSNQTWFLEWLAFMKQKFRNQLLAAPLQPYQPKIRAQQGYLTKMPLAFINRWSQLALLIDKVAETEDELVRLAEVIPPHKLTHATVTVGFKPKSAEEYSVTVIGGVQRRSRNHEKLVASAADFFQGQGALISSPHPLDLLVLSPSKIIIEAKLTGACGPLLAIREAVGQLFEYRFFVGPGDADLCILLDDEPPKRLITYVETILNLQIMWAKPAGFGFGIETARKWCKLGILH